LPPTTSGETARRLTGDGESVLAAARKIAQGTIETIGSSIVEVFKDRALGGSPADSLRVLSSWKSKSDIERIARSLVLLSAYRAEQASPASSYLFLRLLSGEKLVASGTRTMLESDLPALIDDVQDETVRSLLLDSIGQAGATGNVSVSVGGITHISVDESSSYPVIVSPSFHTSRSLTSRQIVVFDGVIESVGQVNTFLEKCSLDNSRVLLVARAFSSEVASTIFANNQRGVFDIVPLTPGTSVEDEFTISDLSTVIGQETVNLISHEDDSNCHDVVVENGKLKVHLRDTAGRDELLRKLRGEISQFSDPDILRMLQNRISRISSRRVSVCIGEEFGDTREIVKERFDHGMRCFLVSRRKGITMIGCRAYPGDSYKIALSTYEAFRQLVRNTGGALVIDKKVEVAKRRDGKNRRARVSHS